MDHVVKTRLVTAGVISAVFGSGVLIGYAADTNIRAEAAEVTSAAEAAGDAGAEERTRRQPMYAQVDPTAEQQVMIDDIVRRYRKRTNHLDEERRAAFQRGLRELTVETREEIKAVLSPRQAQEYQRLLDEWDARQAAEREGGDGER
jgi:Spy/CpxP family protein refolding chaperone